jgi:GTP-binding protein HflX
MSRPEAEERPATVLVAVQLPDVSDEEHAASLAELGRLCHTMGLDVVATLTQRRATLSKGAVVGEGKLRQLGELTGGPGKIVSAAKQPKDKARRAREATEEIEEDDLFEEDDESLDPIDRPSKKPVMVVVDHEITPSQAKNLEAATDCEVLDRTGVIVEIFHRHARSREAKLQVEIARLAYVAPRMRESRAGGGDRVRGGVGGKGAGESALELDRRKIRDRIAELRHELEAIQRDQDRRRQHRREARRVALVGYTNAGKSSLMRALTGSEVYVADKLFATLDTTVRALHPEAKPRILVSDTVGFIKNLPHGLVASFKSTLDEALEASLLLFVVDASDPTHESQLEVSRSVLAEIGADKVPSRLVMNKVDRMDAMQIAKVRADHPDAIFLSAKVPGDVARLRQIIIDTFEADMIDGELVVPYGKQRLLEEIHTHARVVKEEWGEVGAALRVRAEPAALARLQSLLAK